MNPDPVKLPAPVLVRAARIVEVDTIRSVTALEQLWWNFCDKATRNYISHFNPSGVNKLMALAMTLNCLHRGIYLPYPGANDL